MAVFTPRRRSARARMSDVLAHGLAVLFCVFVLLPLVYMVLVALQPTAAAGTEVIPRTWAWRTFLDIWQTVNLGTYLINSIIISVATGVFASIVALGSAYVIARFRFRFRNAFRTSLLTSLTIPGILLLLPLYIMFVIIFHATDIQLVGTYWGVVITYMAFALPFAIWMLNVYIIGLPFDIEEQALVDGATRFQIVRWITLPLALPGLVVTFIFSFLLSWNDVLYASVLTSASTRTLGVGLQYYLSENYSLPKWNELMAASIVSAVPAVVLFLLVQRHIVTGLAHGSVKG